MRILVAVAVMVLLVSPVKADSSEFAWDVVHITGSALLTAEINHLTSLNWWQSALVTFVLGVVWECCDEIAYQLKWKNNIWDHYKGFDKYDILRNGIGISLSFPIRKK